MRAWWNGAWALLWAGAPSLGFRLSAYREFAAVMLLAAQIKRPRSGTLLRTIRRILSRRAPARGNNDGGIHYRLRALDLAIIVAREDLCVVKALRAATWLAYYGVPYGEVKIKVGVREGATGAIGHMWCEWRGRALLDVPHPEDWYDVCCDVEDMPLESTLWWGQKLSPDRAVLINLGHNLAVETNAFGYEVWKAIIVEGESIASFSCREGASGGNASVIATDVGAFVHSLGAVVEGR